MKNSALQKVKKLISIGLLLLFMATWYTALCFAYYGVYSISEKLSLSAGVDVHSALLLRANWCLGWIIALTLPALSVFVYLVAYLRKADLVRVWLFIIGAHFILGLLSIALLFDAMVIATWGLF